jgi:hypothetical protein
MQGLYSLGARRIGVTSLPPMGCLPASVTLFGGGNAGCVERLNNDSLTFNRKLGVAADAVKRRHPDLKLVVFDIYQPLLDLVQNPTNAGMGLCLLSVSPRFYGMAWHGMARVRWMHENNI